MRCPICQAAGSVSDTKVIMTRDATRAAATTRRRRCKANSAHVFDTHEGPSAYPLQSILVSGRRRSGELAPFAVSRLRDDISLGVLKPLKPGELAVIVEDVTRDLQTTPEILEHLTLEESQEHPHAVVKVRDVDLRTLVERRLRNASDEVAHVRYALTFRGRIDIAPGEGFQQAEDFLAWVRDEHGGGLAKAVPVRPGIRAEQRAWPPSEVPHPRAVIKREGHDQPFDAGKFEESIYAPFFGRSHPRRMAKMITSFVLGELAGQERVSTFQLASAVMDTLRRVDDIAFLRYASIAKRFSTVRAFVEEAEGLVRRPSPELIFDRGMGVSVTRPRILSQGVEGTS